jgi:isocitrate dehydrogenase (NAD+)
MGFREREREGERETGAARRIVAAAGAPVEWEPAPAGAGAVAQHGDPMPAVTLDAIRRNRLALKGPLATPKGGGYRSANVTLRQALDLHTGVRPVRNLPGVETPYNGVDLLVLRENTEDLYAGIEHEVAAGTVLTLKVSTRRAGERIARWAFEYMRHRGRRTIHCCHKALVVPLADGAFRDAFHAVGDDYPFIERHEIGVDTLAFELVQDPTRFDVFLLQNLYGDILSDLAAGLVGGLGVVPGANIGDRVAVFEAVHGTAPDIAGQGLANPLAVVMSATMMLEYVGERTVAARIERAVYDVLEAGAVRTRDLGGTADTSTFTEAILDRL